LASLWRNALRSRECRGTTPYEEATAMSDEITKLIRLAREGNSDGRKKLFELVYDEIRAIAARKHRGHANGIPVQPTEWIGEFYLQNSDSFPEFLKNFDGTVRNGDRSTFFSFVAMAIRSIVADYHRKANASKRGGGRVRRSMTGVDREGPDEGWVETDALMVSLRKLEKQYPDWHDVIVSRYLCENTIAKTADVLGIAQATVKSRQKLGLGALRGLMDGADR